MADAVVRLDGPSRERSRSRTREAAAALGAGAIWSRVVRVLQCGVEGVAEGSEISAVDGGN
eukprot:14614840-Alexandrium_andersonii.AAC.1